MAQGVSDIIGNLSVDMATDLTQSDTRGPFSKRKKLLEADSLAKQRVLRVE